MVCSICHSSVFEPAQTVHEHDIAQTATQSSSSRTASSRPAALTCGHVFHSECITIWLASSASATCPSCNSRSAHAPLLLYLELDAEDVPHAVPSQRHRHHSQQSNIDDLIRQTEGFTLDATDSATENAHISVAHELSLLAATLESQKNEIDELTAKAKLYKKKKGHLYAALALKKAQITELSRELAAHRTQQNRNPGTARGHNQR
ncbi:hypothetical protein LPJ53_005757 [Coemansia erecta]|uniref:RING-type domain-containing protein n=1 Tax=Coemansia erecta TaxID=147472 RepID=A0A9W7XUY2_9FUNG|nr:hypothetical protein LPJ53_005757 [Coemansia erecta]